MLAQNIHETNPTPPRSRLRIVTEVREAPETAQYDEMNQEFLSSLGGLSVEEWYRQNGLSNADGLHTQGITTEDRMASLVESWEVLSSEAAEALGSIATDSQLA